MGFVLHLCFDQRVASLLSLVKVFNIIGESLQLQLKPETSTNIGTVFVLIDEFVLDAHSARNLMRPPLYFLFPSSSMYIELIL